MNPTDSYPAKMTQDTFAPDRLIVGGKIRSRKITILSGQVGKRGWLLGKKITAATVAGAAGAGNTGGSGTIGTLSAGTGVQVGVYKAVCIEPAANAGTFAVYDPQGVFIGHATVAVAFTGQVNFTIADATDFVAGDFFTITVSAPTEKYLLSAAAAVDGSQTPDLVLSEDKDATSGDLTAMAYESGEFDETAVIYGAGHTAATVHEGLRQKGIHLINPAVTA